MKSKESLTKRRIDGLQYQADGENTFIAWDSEMEGFGVRVYPSGKKSYCIAYQTGGRKRFMTIGKAGRITVSQAKEIAQKR